MISEPLNLKESEPDNEYFNLSSAPAPGFSGDDENPGLFMSIILHFTTFLFPVLFSFTFYCITHG